MSEPTCICFHCAGKLLTSLAYYMDIHGHERVLHLCCFFTIIDEQLYGGDFRQLGVVRA